MWGDSSSKFKMVAFATKSFRAAILAFGFAMWWVTASDAYAKDTTARRSWTVIDGALEVIYLDAFSNKDEKKYYIKKPRARKKIVKFLGTKPNLRSGDLVKIRARILRNNAVAVRTKRDILFRTSRASSGVLGARKIALIRIQALDGGPSCSAPDLVGRMWTGPRSINGLYVASSYGKLSFTQDSNADSQADVFQVNINENTLGRCNQYSSIASAADTALTAMGVNVASFNHRVYILPTNVRYSQLDSNGNPVPSSEKTSECYWAGMASLGGAHTWIPGEWCGVTDDSIDVISHELGHNLGLGHARSDSNQDGSIDSPDGEYSDLSCPMGRANRSYRHFNAPHKIQSGWVDYSTIVNSSGLHTLTALDGATATNSQPHALKIVTRLGTLFVSYRAPSDAYNSSWQANYYGKTNIHWGGMTPGASYYVSALADGQTYRDPDSGAQITQLSHTATTAVVSISIGNVAPAPPTGLVVTLR